MIDTQLPIRRVPLAVVDVETTGLSAERGDRVCEIAVIRVDPGDEPLVYSMLVDPGRPISAGATAVNGIRDCDVAGAPRFAEVIPELELRLADAVLVAHNAPFDLGFLTAEYAYAGRSPPRNPALDTLALARRRFNFGRNDLGSVARRLGVAPHTEHRAEGDAWTTYHVFLRMSTLLAARGWTSLGEILRAQGGAATSAVTLRARLPEPLGTAVAEHRRVVIRYQDGARRTTEREIEPRLASRDYLVAFCHLRGEERTFRLDRILDSRWPE